jgi:hypothetical protein
MAVEKTGGGDETDFPGYGWDDCFGWNRGCCSVHILEKGGKNLKKRFQDTKETRLQSKNARTVHDFTSDSQVLVCVTFNSVALLPYFFWFSRF